MKPELSIIILSYNNKELTIQAVESIEKNYKNEIVNGVYQVIVADNGSPDGSLEALYTYKKNSKIKLLEIIDNKENIGFGRGNNKGVQHVKGKHVLFLNNDTIVYKQTLSHLLYFLTSHKDIGAVTCKLINKDGELDFNCHRGFPTPWNAFCYFSGFQRLFPRSRIFAGYTQGWKDFNSTHEVDAIEGAFMLIPYEVGEKIGWWDEDYFFNGEDLQFCFSIKKLGYKVYYVGEVSIMHIGGAASGIKKKAKNITTATSESKKRIQLARFDAMKLFYKKNYQSTYPKWVYWLIITGINTLKSRELTKLKLKA